MTLGSVGSKLYLRQMGKFGASALARQSRPVLTRKNCLCNGINCPSTARFDVKRAERLLQESWPATVLYTLAHVL